MLSFEFFAWCRCREVVRSGFLWVGVVEGGDEVIRSDKVFDGLPGVCRVWI